jgi:ATP-dependent Lon protease
MTDLVPELEVQDGESVPIPSALPVLPLKDTIVFPQSMSPLAVGQERSVRLVDDVLSGDRLLALVASRDPELEQPGLADLHEIGTAALVHRMLRMPDGTMRVLVQGLSRVRLGRPVSEEPYLVAEVEEVPDVVVESKELEALVRNVQDTFARLIELVPYLPDELGVAAANVDDPSVLSYLVASTVRVSTEDKQRLLELLDVEERLRETTRILSRELEVVELGSRIQSQVVGEMERTQREYVLRQQLRAIQEELGEGDPEQVELKELRSRLDEADLPEHARDAAERELARLERLPSAAAEYGVIRTYLEWLLTLPWNQMTPDNLDLDQARTVLDEDHYNLEKVKDRILEFLAVGKLRQDISGQILCFVGPPGVGKTSLGQSIARALGRKFIRISVGGVRDEAEIRGHRRTYIGAMPGTIIRALRDAESRNPVFMIDEIDKMGSDFRGDPSSAMLEVLDPEQNTSFRDHYLDLPFDLSKVLFVCTANQPETIPAPLLDRMDVIQLSGYTEEEKLHIAQRYLVPKQLEAHGLDPAKVEFQEEGIRLVIREYTREAGVRNLERRIADLARKAARRVVEGKRAKMSVNARRVREWLGPRRFAGEAARRTSDPGVATGLAVTPVGGDVLFVEATAYPGRGRLTITGQLGDVMEESARAAHSWVRSQAQRLGIDPDWFSNNDIHVHVPAGAVPKDGPSAGITIATAIVSLARGEPVDSDVAMTGEVTLSGQVLQIGGVRDKVLAAQRAGLERVVLPKDNEPDLEELPPEARGAVQFVLADSMDDVLRAVFAGQSQPARRRAAASERQAAARRA